ncbi:TE: Transposable element Tcb1 [Brachionus plicatilis]|uniref:TE: Transposable element Tcb1 n=1 Tax=Brachionus plicatilis TaxID=10195 RepID=A0A3M7S216_BRAPC|nr:TE: Transposable element Tcb1 [Brachionus plicatilis]
MVETSRYMIVLILTNILELQHWCSERDSITEETEPDKDFVVKFDHGFYFFLPFFTGFEDRHYSKDRFIIYDTLLHIPKLYHVHPKKRSKINVWGGISFKGTTEFAKFKENMNAELYCEILAKYFLPFGAHKYNYFFKLHQDNDPKHTTSLCTSYLTENDVYRNTTVISEKMK